MAGCKYSHPTKKDVLNEMTEAFRTLDNYLETPEGTAEDVPDIFMPMIKYINQLKEECKGNDNEKT